MLELQITHELLQARARVHSGVAALACGHGWQLELALPLLAPTKDT
jgi:hypothetical protein